MFGTGSKGCVADLVAGDGDLPLAAPPVFLEVAAEDRPWFEEPALNHVK
jgi:hypothetical protein